MLSYLAAVGHHLYTTSIYILLQKMLKINETHPQLYEHFKRGHHMSLGEVIDFGPVCLLIW